MKRLVLLLALASFPVHARQEGSKLYKPPVTPLEYWTAINLERDLGSPEQAAKLLGELVKKVPTDAQLLEIVEKQPEGTIAFSRLVAARWSEDEKVQEQAHKDARTLLVRAQEAVRKRAGDEPYIRRLIAQLKGDREERAYATRELGRLREMTIPYLLDALAGTKVASERLGLLGALERLGGAEAVPPLVAALEGYPKNPDLKKDVLDLLRKKHSVQGRRIAPFLVFPSANRAEDSGVRAKARKLLAEFLETKEGRLPPAKVA
ncbi:MAG: hypothetical protein K2W96_16115, partial [Gemmataceae bacterium]|nr:hypothetical protein [Gemmataceae bacterium]